MKYALVAEAVASAIFLFSSGALATEYVVLSDSNTISWECTGDSCSEAYVDYYEASGEGDDYVPSSLLVSGDSLSIGSHSEWQSIEGVESVALVGNDISVYAASTNITDRLSVMGTTAWHGSPQTLVHQVETISLDDAGTTSRLDLKVGLMEAESIEWGGKAEIVLHGFDKEAGLGTSGSGAILATKSMHRDEMISSEDATLSVRLEGNSALVLGETACQKYIGSEAKVKQLKTQIANADAVRATGGVHRATLLTTSSVVEGLGEGVVITVGTTEAVSAESGASKIVIGSEGRWIYDVAADSSEAGMTLADDGTTSTTVPITAQSGAELYLVGWTGEDLLLSLDPSWNDASGVQLLLENSPFIGRTSLSNGTLSVERKPWASIEGLSAREIAEEAESFYLTADSDAVPDIGRKYLRNVVTAATSVQLESLIARNIDTTVFLAGTAGLLKSADNAQRRTHEALLSHEPGMETEANLYWWASAYMGYGSTDKVTSGSRRNSSEDFYGGTLGVDYRFAQNWIGTLAVSGAASDIETPDVKKASLTLAAASASIHYAVNDRHRLFAAATYSQTQGEATRISNGYRAKTEPDFRQLTADVGWKAYYELENSMHFRPAFSIGWERGRMRKGDVTLTTQDGTTSGVGFVQSVDDRQVWHVRGTADLSGRFNLWGYSVEPGASAGLTIYAGDTDWTMTSRLAEGTATSRKDFHSNGRWQFSGGLSLTISDCGREPVMEGGIFGFGAKNTGKTKPYDWALTVFGTGEAGAYGSHAVSFGLRYREIF